MENVKPEFLEVIEDISKFVGAFAGAAVVTGKRIQDGVKSMITELKPSDRTAKKPVKVRAKKKKTKKHKRTTRPRSHPASEQG
jgi:hypothetical protein